MNLQDWYLAAKATIGWAIATMLWLVVVVMVVIYWKEFRR